MVEKEKEETEGNGKAQEEKQEEQSKEEVENVLDLDIKVSSMVSTIIAQTVDKTFKGLVRDVANSIGQTLGCTITIKWAGEQVQRRNAIPLTNIPHGVPDCKICNGKGFYDGGDGYKRVCQVCAHDCFPESLDHPNEAKMSHVMNSFEEEVKERSIRGFHETKVCHSTEAEEQTSVWTVCNICGWKSLECGNELEARFYGLTHSFSKALKVKSLKRRNGILDRTRKTLIGE